MNGTWFFSPDCSRRAALALAGALIFALTAAGCSLAVSPNGVEAVTPSARVSLSPAMFCVGETLTATYDGGPQVSSCDSAAPDSQECKGASLRGSGLAVSFPFGYAESNLRGSASAPAETLARVGVTYQVEWETWSHYNDLRVPAQPGSGQTWTGRVVATDSADPFLDGGRAVYFDLLVCDEETHTVRFGRDLDRGAFLSRSDGAGGWDSPSSSGVLSACAAVDQVCISELDAASRWRLSVEGGPSVVLGGPDNPRCTDAFRGYHPDDISLEAVDVTGYGRIGPAIGAACDPDNFDSDWRGASIVQYYVGGSTLCAVDHEDGELGRWDGESLDGFQFGSIPLVGAARERCLAALDPAFVAQIPLVPVDLVEGSAPPPVFPIVIGEEDEGVPGLAAVCDLENTCGDGACQDGCEDALSCAQDCEPSEATCPPGTYYAPVTNQCIAIQIPEPKKEKGGGDDGGSCPAGQSWKCKAATFPPVCSCQ